MRASRIFIALAAVWLLAWLGMWGAYNSEFFGASISVENIIELSRPLARHPVAPLIIAGAYLCSVLVVFPRALLTVPAVIVFGPWLTFFSGMSGLIVGAWCGFWVGRNLPGAKLRSVSRSPRLARLEEKLRCGGVGAVVLVRLVPVAPFTVINMFLGVLRLRTGDFVLGTFLGLLPGFSFSIFIGDRLRTIIHNQGAGNLFLLGLQLIGAGIVLFLLWRMATAKLKESD
jgi:phospholipase D1/2